MSTTESAPAIDAGTPPRAEILHAIIKLDDSDMAALTDAAAQLATWRPAPA